MVLSKRHVLSVDRMCVRARCAKAARTLCQCSTSFCTSVGYALTQLHLMIGEATDAADDDRSIQCPRRDAADPQGTGSPLQNEED